MATIQDRLANALKKLGETEIPGRSRKYRVFTKNGGGFYFLGKAGALRVGPTISGSASMSDATKSRLMGEQT